MFHKLFSTKTQANTVDNRFSRAIPTTAVTESGYPLPSVQTIVKYFAGPSVEGLRAWRGRSQCNRSREDDPVKSRWFLCSHCLITKPRSVFEEG